MTQKIMEPELFLKVLMIIRKKIYALFVKNGCCLQNRVKKV